MTQRVPIASLVPDATNARRHGQKNLRAIAASLKNFGQQVPILIEKGTNRVIAGNGTLTAMKALGWTECDVIESDKTGKEARALAVALNKTSELAEWDEDMLQTQLREQLLDYDLESLGWDDRKLAQLLSRDTSLPTFEEADVRPESELCYRIIVDCEGEAQQAALLQKFEAEGLTCQPLIS